MDETEHDIINVQPNDRLEFEMKRVENNRIGSFDRDPNP